MLSDYADNTQEKTACRNGRSLSCRRRLERGSVSRSVRDYTRARGRLSGGIAVGCHSDRRAERWPGILARRVGRRGVHIRRCSLLRLIGERPSEISDRRHSADSRWQRVLAGSKERPGVPVWRRCAVPCHSSPPERTCCRYCCLFDSEVRPSGARRASRAKRGARVKGPAGVFSARGDHSDRSVRRGRPVRKGWPVCGAPPGPPVRTVPPS